MTGSCVPFDRGRAVRRRWCLVGNQVDHDPPRSVSITQPLPAVRQLLDQAGILTSACSQLPKRDIAAVPGPLCLVGVYAVLPADLEIVHPSGLWVCQTDPPK